MYKIQFRSNHVFEGSGMANNGLSLKHVEKKFGKKILQKNIMLQFIKLLKQANYCRFQVCSIFKMLL